jgi:hypothetical protein
VRSIEPAFHSRDVTTCAEGFAGAGQHQGTDHAIRGKLLDRGDELRAHVIANCIAFFRAVQNHGCNAGCDLNFDQPGHVVSARPEMEGIPCEGFP